MVRCAPPRTRAAVGEEAGEAGAAARCSCRSDGNVALAAMLDIGAGTAGIVGVAAPPAPVPFAVLALRRPGAVSADDDDDDKEEELEGESGYGGGEGKLGCKPVEAGWPAKDVSSDARVGAVAVDGSGLAGSGSVRSSQRAAAFSVDMVARVGRCGREADGWIEEMVTWRWGCGGGD
jgi:hypothetical protein